MAKSQTDIVYDEIPLNHLSITRVKKRITKTLLNSYNVLNLRMLSWLVLATVFTSAFGAWITIYEHTSFGGKSRTFTDSVYNLKDFGFGDKISSVKVGSGRNWIFYQHHGYSSIGATLGRRQVGITTTQFPITMNIPL